MAETLRLEEVLVHDEACDVVCDALTRWFMLTGAEPDNDLVERAVRLYNLGNGTTATLVDGLRAELAN